MAALRVTVWNEGRHEKIDEEIRKVYPDGIHAVLAAALREAGCAVRTATLDDDAEHGLNGATWRMKLSGTRSPSASSGAYWLAWG